MRAIIEARNRTIAIADGVIVEPDGDFDLVLTFADADVRPGLINAHEHLHRNHYGRLGAPPYVNACDWAHDIQTRHRDEIAQGRRLPRREALLAGAWKNLFAGVTSVVHHDLWEPDFEDRFPLKVIRAANADSLRMTPTLEGFRKGHPFCLHVAEGIDAGAALDVHELAWRGLLNSDLVAVHGVGMDAAGVARFRAAGAALVWCPTSNLFLLGRTAPAELLSDGVDVLLGSDSLLTGAGDLLDELRHANGLGMLSVERLEAAVGTTAARRLGVPAPCLEVGAAADFVVLSRSILDARASDVALVVVDGAPRVAAPELGPLLSPTCPGGVEMEVGGVTRWTDGDSGPQPNGRLFQ